MQKILFTQFGVRVDPVLQGHGTTNTRNLARKCFRNPQKFAQSLGLDKLFVANIALLLQLFKCKKELKFKKTEKFCWETYDMHYSLYPWARMNPTMHKFLRHGCEISSRFPLPIAYYAEDVLEEAHKYYRRNMVLHARQNSRKNRV